MKNKTLEQYKRALDAERAQYSILKKSIEAQLIWDKLLLEAFDKRIEMETFDKTISDPQQLEQHLEHETRAETLSGGEGMEQP